MPGDISPPGCVRANQRAYCSNVTWPRPRPHPVRLGLYLSHRTIGTHLYRIFPKLGITSRGELRSALSARS